MIDQQVSLSIPVKKAKTTARIPGVSKQHWFLLITLWMMLTAINIDKAFHIDDSFHLEAAAYIRNHPGKPMSGLINWEDVPAPLHSFNQPPLFFYCIALVIHLFSANEITLHLLLSVFTFLSLYYFHKTSQLLSLKNPGLLLTLFACCPAFIANQNVMTDVPVLSLTLGSVYFLLKARYHRKTINYCLSALLIGLGLLIKYSILPLLMVLVVVILIRRDYKYLPALAIPIMMLSLWSLWNYMEYGAIHILNRPLTIFRLYTAGEFVACLGAVSSFSISLIFCTIPAKKSNLILFILSVIVPGSIGLFVFGYIHELHYARFLNLLFFLNGLAICIALLKKLLTDLKTMNLQELAITDRFVFLLILCSISAFIVLFAPFIATRHVLLIIPFILFYGSGLIDKAAIRINRLALTGTIVLGLLLGLSDWKYADYYREMASSIQLPKTGTVWTAGHWGWQWYASQNGMKQYHTKLSEVRDGDYFVHPGNIAIQQIPKNIRLTVIARKWKQADALTFVSGSNHANLYASSVYSPPWSLSRQPIDTIFICKVKIQK